MYDPQKTGACKSLPRHLLPSTVCNPQWLDEPRRTLLDERCVSFDRIIGQMSSLWQCLYPPTEIESTNVTCYITRCTGSASPPRSSCIFMPTRDSDHYPLLCAAGEELQLPGPGLSKRPRSRLCNTTFMDADGARQNLSQSIITGRTNRIFNSQQLWIQKPLYWIWLARQRLWTTAPASD
ncbi:hypothetical protein DM819_16385 [Pseudomonas hunanensis]|uniref:Uncharacterized protein n=1 Tax=Pseudomonas hunanensis TaxID=1247546 RepID=A0ABD6NFG4_9PSED|nr:hypothetical protein [Pseudomonas hunanensis]